MTAAERRRLGSERAGAAAILLAGPLLGLVLFALTWRVAVDRGRGGPHASRPPRGAPPRPEALAAELRRGLLSRAGGQLRAGPPGEPPVSIGMAAAMAAFVAGSCSDA